MIHRDFLYHLAFTSLESSLRGRLNSFCGPWLRCNSLEWGASKRCTRGPCEAGIGQRRGCRDRVMAPHHATGSHLPSEGTAPPCAVAPFRVVAPCPAPQKPLTPPRPTTGFRIMIANNNC